MKVNVKAVDVHWTADGDLFITDEGNMHLASYDQNEVLVGAVVRRLQSSKGDWRNAPHLGTDLMALIGLPNTYETADAIKSMITNSLTSDGLIAGDQMSILCLPIDKHRVLVTLQLRALQGEKPIMVGFTYDLRDNKMIPRIISN